MGPPDSLAERANALKRRWKSEDDTHAKYALSLAQQIGRSHLLSPDEARRYAAQIDRVAVERQREVRRRYGTDPRLWRELLEVVRAAAVRAYDELGFADHRTQEKPVNSWTVLKVLAERRISAAALQDGDMSELAVRQCVQNCRDVLPE